MMASLLSSALLIGLNVFFFTVMSTFAVSAQGLVHDVHGRQHMPTTDQRHPSSKSSRDDYATDDTINQPYPNTGALGIRFDMTRRNTSCAGIPMLGSDPRSRRLACALKSSSHRLKKLAGRKSSPNYLRNIVHDEATSPGESYDSYEFPESAGSGEYLVPIYLGRPPQKANIIIDTGSDLSWIQSQPCSSCYSQEDPIFNPSKSSTYQRLSCSSAQCQDLLGTACSSTYCTYRYGYGDGSETRGYFSTETITVQQTTGTQTEVPLFAFGASVYSTGTFAQTGGEGILGLGQGPVSVPSQLGMVFGNKFSYCLVDWFSDSSVTSTMVFGDAAVPAAETAPATVQYTPIVSNPNYRTYYYINVLGVSVGGSRLSIDPSVFEIDSSGSGGTIIDSGTTITYLQQAAYNKIVEGYRSRVSYPTTTSASGLDLCFDTSRTDTPSFPSLAIHLEGADLILPTSNTFVNMEADTMCLAFAGTNAFISILGNIQQQNFEVVYDLENKQIGFMPTDCASM